MIQRSTCQAGKHGICHPIDTAFDREKSAWGLLAAAYVLGVIGVFFCPLLFCVAGVVYAVIAIVKGDHKGGSVALVIVVALGITNDILII